MTIEYWTKDQLESEMSDIMAGQERTHENCGNNLTMRCEHFKRLKMPDIRLNLTYQLEDPNKMKQIIHSVLDICSHIPKIVTRRATVQCIFMFRSVRIVLEIP